MLNVGDRIVVSGFDIPVFITKVYFENDDGEEVFEFEASRKMLALKWGKNGEHGKSKVAMHDQDKIWFVYRDLN